MPGIITSAIKPKTAPITTIRMMIRIFSRIGLFLRRRTARPIPAPENKPESISPPLMRPAEARVVRTTDAAQLGIRPNIAVRRWLTRGISGRTEISASSPMKYTNEFMPKVTRRMKSDIFKVCAMAGRRIPSP